MRRLHFRHCLLALLTCLLIAACGHQAQQTPGVADCRTVSHVLGSTEFCDRPDKIVALDAHSLDLLLSLGQQPAGTLTILPSQSEVIEQPRVAIPYLGEYITTQPVNIGGIGSGPSLEVLTQLQPDLIVGESRYIKEAADLLTQIAPTLPLDIRSQKGKWRDNIRALAQALGDETLAEAAIESYQQQVAAARADLASVLATQPKVLVLTAESLSTGSFQAITAASFIGELLEAVGFELVYPPDSTTNAAPLSIEILPDLDEADSVFVLGYNRDLAQPGEATAGTDPNTLMQQQVAGIEAEWTGNKIAQSLTASQENRVYFTTFYEWNLFNGPIGTELILADLRQFFLAS
ncbi:MAG: ABC transporter substrate-binding protein [Leptolyngbyaceae cyanobacterium]